MRTRALFAVVITFILGACAPVARPLPPLAAVHVVVGPTYEVAPPYYDPEYVLRLTLPAGGWDERRSLDAGPGKPDPAIMLTRRGDGLKVEALFMPSLGHVVAQAGEVLRADYEKQEANSCSPLVVNANGGDAGFSATIDGAFVVVHAFRLEGMSKSFAVLRLSAPVAKKADVVAASETVWHGLTLVRTGPLSPKERLAQCLADKGVVMYGTTWCGPCKVQLLQFAEGASRLNHVMCDDEKAGNPADVCTKAKLKVVPTWTFPDGSRLEGGQSLDALADKAGCPKVPQSE